ncbi:hypothetical protein HK096_000526, partial [Nowakowskiella sp. JEL0078]
SQVARVVGEKIPHDFAKTINVIYFPQLGFLVTLPFRENMKNQEDFVVEGLKFQ